MTFQSFFNFGKFFNAMRNIKRPIFLFVLALSTFVMLSHSVILHHHHTHSITLHEEDSCDEDTGHENEQKEPFHCHAFNDTDWYSTDNGFENSWQEFVFLFSITEILNEKSVEKTLNHLPPELLKHKQLFFNDLTSRPPPFLS